MVKGLQTAIVVSPHIKREIETEPHKGTPVSPEPINKPEKINAPVAPPAGQIKNDGKHTSTAVQKKTQTAKGFPLTILLESTEDWAKRNHLSALLLWGLHDFSKGAKGQTKPAITPKTQSDFKPQTNPEKYKVSSLDQKPPKEVTALVKVMEEQVGWHWYDMFKKQKKTSTTIKEGIVSGTFKPLTGKEATTFDHYCFASVKVGLWRANLVKGVDGGPSACGAGPWLVKQGFRDVTKTLPDGCWALPGDVIVYRNSDAEAARRHKNYAKALEQYKIVKPGRTGNLSAYRSFRHIVQNPEYIGHRFRFELDTDSGKGWTVIPVLSGH